MKKLAIIALCGLGSIACAQEVDPLDIRQYTTLTDRVPGAGGAATVTKMQVTFAPGYTWGNGYTTWASSLGVAFFQPGGQGTFSLSGKYAEKRLNAGGVQGRTHSLVGVYQLNKSTPDMPVGRLSMLYQNTPGAARVLGLGLVVTMPFGAAELGKPGVSGDATLTYLDVRKPGMSDRGATLDLALTFNPILDSIFEVGYTLPSKIQGASTYFVRVTRSFGPISKGGNSDEWLGRLTVRKDSVLIIEGILKFKY